MPTDAEIGQHLDMAPRNVQRMRADGLMPPPGSSLDACRLAYIRHMREAAAGRLRTNERSDLDSEKARLAREQADQIAMKNAQMRKDWAPIAGLRDAMIGQVEIIKSRLNRVPAKVAQGDPVLKAKVTREIKDCLIDLSAERAIEEATGAAEPESDDEDGG